MSKTAMNYSKAVAAVGTSILAAVLLLAPSAQSIATNAISTITDNAVNSLVPSVWPFEHGKCFTLDRFAPTYPHCL